MPTEVVEDAEHALLEQRRGAYVVGRQVAVSEQVSIAGVQQQLCALGRLDKVAGNVEIALRDEQLVGVHRVDLQRDALRPRTPELGDRDTGMKTARLLSRPAAGELQAYAQLRGRPRPVNDAWIAAC